MDRVLVNQGARGRLASDSLKDFSNLALASLSLTNTTGLGSGIRRCATPARTTSRHLSRIIKALL